MKNSTVTIEVACAIIFLLFTFSYILFQGDLLILAQHVWSGGQTHYNPYVGAALITLILWIIQLGIKALIKLPYHARTVSYFPSLLFIGILTSVSPDESGNMSVGNWWWVSILLLVNYGFVVNILSEYAAIQREPKRNGLLSRVSWSNITILAAMFLFTISIANTDRPLHDRLHMERLIKNGDFSTAGEMDCACNDSTTTMMRALALSKTGQLGDLLFHYPLTGGSMSLIPQPDGSVTHYFSGYDSLWVHLGGIPRYDTGNPAEHNTLHFLRKLKRQGMATPAVNDYILAADLLDRDLKSFATDLLALSGDSAFTAGESAYTALPRHYREALVVYTRMHSDHGLPNYSDPVVDADYEDFLSITRHKTKHPEERLCAIRDTYGQTFWAYYYKYAKP